MSRDSETPPAPQEPEQTPHGRLKPTSPAALTVCAVAGLVGGWLLRRVAEEWRGTAPVVTWVQPLALLLVAAILGVTARATWRTVQVRRQRLAPHQAVNRLVLARSCALVGALAAGGYLGYALSWLGVESDLAEQRVVRSAIAGVAGIAITVAALLLERACRVRDEDDDRVG